MPIKVLKFTQENLENYWLEFIKAYKDTAQQPIPNFLQRSTLKIISESEVNLYVENKTIQEEPAKNVIRQLLPHLKQTFRIENLILSVENNPKSKYKKKTSTTSYQEQYDLMAEKTPAIVKFFEDLGLDFDFD